MNSNDDAFANASEKRLEKRLRGIYRQASKELAEKVDSFFANFKRLDAQKAQMVKEGKLSETEYQEWRRNKFLMGQKYADLRDTMVARMQKADEIAMSYINGELPAVYAHNFNKVGTDAQELVQGFSFDLVNEEAVRRLSTSKKTLLPYKVVDGKRNERWNTKHVNAAILQGILQGESIPKIAKRLSSVTEMNKASAIRNARTALTGAQNAGRYEAMVQLAKAGLPIKKQWFATTGDGRTRHAHLELHLTTIPYDKPFENSIGRIMFPGDPNAHPSNVYNCRCSLASDFTEVIKMAQEKKAEQQKETQQGVEGKDISETWKRRPDQFAFEIEDVVNAQGFDGLPMVVDSDEEFDRYVKKSNFIAQRAYTAPDQETLKAYQEQLYSGKWYIDCSHGGSMYGRGMYCDARFGTSVSSSMNTVMAGYGSKNPNGMVETFTLQKDAKILNYSDLEKERRNIGKGRMQALMAKHNFTDDEKLFIYSQMGFTDTQENILSSNWMSAHTERAREILQGFIQETIPQRSKILNEVLQLDRGTVAVLRGYDAINCEDITEKDEDGYFVILNRTKCVFRRNSK